MTTINPRNFVFFEANRIAVQFEPDAERIEALRKVCVQYQCPYSAGELWRATLPLTAKDDVSRLFALLQWSDAFRHMMRGSLAKFDVAAPPITDRILARLGNLASPVGEGLTLYHHQIEGVQWLARTPRGILGDDMGCISGDAIIHANRAGRGFKIELSELYRKFNGLTGRWSKDFETSCRALCGEEFRQHKIEKVISKGEKPCVTLTTCGGKSISLTADHEVATPGGFIEAGKLKPGDEVLTNGRMFGKNNPNWKGGKFTDSDGYVRCSGNQTHPRHTTGGVYEHILVMEAHLGRFITSAEDVHHKNEIRHDNRLENLEVLTKKAHLARHKTHLKLNGTISANGGEVWLLPEVQTVKSITPFGTREVFDLVMADPHRNFVANGFVVHNCGKTIQSLLTAKAIYEETGAHTVIITKACLIHDWRKEARKIDHRVVSCYSWAKIPAPTPGQKYVVIADEAHLAQNSESIRGKAFQEWARASEWVWMLTGTPMMNGQHSNLFALIKALRHPLAVNKKEFERVYCGAKRIVLDHRFKIDDEKFLISWTCKKCRFVNRQRWNYAWKSYTCGGCMDKLAAPKTFIEKSGAKNAPELKRQLAPYILRRMKSECLDLPPKTRIIREIEISKESQAVYDTAIHSARARYSEKVANGLINKSGEALAILTMVRIAASMAKVSSAIELAEEALEEEIQPVIFFEFVQPVKLIAAHFKITPYIGETHKDTKPRLVENFQDRMQKVFAGTREAGGTGLTLTAGNVVILGDRPLRPGEVDQAEDRLLRIGQNWPVTSYWLRAFPVCHKIDGYLARKQKAIDAFLGGGQSEGEQESGAREVLRDLFG